MSTTPQPADPPWLDRDLWPFPTLHLHGEEGRMAYVREGQGPPVLFVHGTPTWGIDWRHLIAGLAPTHTCIAVDHLGLGLSDRPASAGYRPEDHARRFSAFANTLDLHDVTVVLHDFGGPFALPWIFDHLDRVRRVVVLNSFAFPFTDPMQRRVARLLGGRVGRCLYARANLSLRVIAPGAWADRSKLTPSLQAQLLGPFPHASDHSTVLWALAHAMLASEPFYVELEGRLPTLAAVPVDLVWGLADPAFPAAALARWQAALPHAHTTGLAGVGHWPHEEAPDAVLAVLKS